MLLLDCSQRPLEFETETRGLVIFSEWTFGMGD